MTAPVLEIAGLVAGYGAAPVLDGIDLTVGRGEVVALIGANGAGKSTLLAAVMGLGVRLQHPDGGRIMIDGRDIGRLPAERRARLGLAYVPEGRRVFPGMSVYDNLAVASREPPARRNRAIDRVFALFPQLGGKRGERAWRLSGGQQQMLSIGRALMGAPRVMLLDEPSLGLAPKVAAEVFATVRTIAADGTAVLLAEGSARRALEVADRAAFLARGRIRRQGPAAAFAAAEDDLGGLMLGDPLAGDPAAG